MLSMKQDQHNLTTIANYFSIAFQRICYGLQEAVNTSKQVKNHQVCDKEQYEKEMVRQVKQLGLMSSDSWDSGCAYGNTIVHCVLCTLVIKWTKDSLRQSLLTE